MRIVTLTGKWILTCLSFYANRSHIKQHGNMKVIYTDKFLYVNTYIIYLYRALFLQKRSKRHYKLLPISMSIDIEGSMNFWASIICTPKWKIPTAIMITFWLLMKSDTIFGCFSWKASKFAARKPQFSQQAMRSNFPWCTEP